MFEKDHIKILIYNYLKSCNYQYKIDNELIYFYMIFIFYIPEMNKLQLYVF